MNRVRHSTRRQTAAVCTTLILLGAMTCFGYRNTKEVHAILTENVKLQEEDFSRLRNGRVVTRILPRGDKREVSVFGLIKLDSSVTNVEAAFQAAIKIIRSRSSSIHMKFSNPPELLDTKRLFLEPKEIERLRSCRPGSCDVKLSAQMIERLKNSIDRDLDDYKNLAMEKYREILIDYLKSYIAEGNRALIKYENKPKTISLGDEQESLLENLFWINETAPELAEYLQRFPNRNLPNLEDSFSWSKIKFGLKPVVIMLHTATYDSDKPFRQKLIVSKQIYASRYMDSSLGLTAIIELTGTKENPETYLLFTNYTRASALGSPLGGLARKLVENQAIKELKTILLETRRNLTSKSIDSDETSGESEQGTYIDWFFTNKFLFLLILAIAILISLIFFSKHKSSRRS